MIVDLFPPEYQAIAMIAGFTALVPYTTSMILGLSAISTFLGGVTTAAGMFLISPLLSSLHCWNRQKSTKHTDTLNALVSDVFGKYKTATGKTLKLEDFEIAVYQSDTKNAFATRRYYSFSLNTKPVIYASSGIMEMLSGSNQEALKGVIAHELGHVVGQHSTLQCLSHTLEIVSRQMFKAVKLQFFGRDNSASRSRDAKKSVEFNPALIGLGVLCKTSEVLVNSFLSRRYEYSADNFAVRLGYGEGLKEGLKAIHKNADSDLLNDRYMLTKLYHLIMECFSSHPNLKNRIENIDKQIQRKQSDAEKGINFTGSIAWTIENFIERNFTSYFTSGKGLS